jgi:hypothetical protein
VLLCCINPCPFAKPLDERDLFCMFSHFGRVSNALIFSKKVQVKAFIEFARSADLEAALIGIPQMSFPCGKVRVFKSNKENIDHQLQFRFKRKTSGCPEDLLSRDIDSAQVSQPERRQLKSCFIGTAVQNLSVNSNADPQIHQCLPAPVNDKDYHSTSTQSSIGVPHQVNNGLPSEGQQATSDGRGKYVNILSKPKVTIINGIDMTTITGKFLLNFYSCFGNIVKMLLNREQTYALIEFETEMQASFAIASTRGLSYFGSALRIKMSKYTSLNFKSLDKDRNENLTHFYGNSKLFRHPKNYLLDTSPLSTTVLFQEVPGSVDEVVLFALVSQVHEPCTITKRVPVDQSLRKNYVVRFLDEVQAAEVLSVFHNRKVDLSFLKVAFVSGNSDTGIE